VAGPLAATAADVQEAELHAQTIAQLAGGVLADTTRAEAYTVRRFYFHLQGEIARRRGDLPAAVQAHRMAVRFSSRLDHPFFGTALAQALWAAGERAEAVSIYEQVLQASPSYPNGLLGLGRADLSRGDTLSARRRLSELDGLWSQADKDFPGRRELDELMRAMGPGSPRRG
jgi:predicted Zn-dependent protease